MIQKISSPRIERKREQRLQSLLQTALELVMEEGLAGLTMQKLADRQDLAVGGLYRYFKSKDALLAALQRQVISEFAAVIQAADLCFIQREMKPANEPDRSEALARLLLASEVYFHLPKVCPQRFRLLYEMTISAEPLLGLQEGFQVLQVALPLFKQLESRFDQAAQIQALKAGAASQRAILYWSSLQGLLPLEKLTRFVPLYDLSQLRVELENTLLLGMGAHAEDIKAARKKLKKCVSQSEFLNLFESLLERKLP